MHWARGELLPAVGIFFFPRSIRLTSPNIFRIMKTVMQMNKEIRFAENLRQFRKKAGMTRSDLAEAVQYTEKAVEKWESGKSVPPLETLSRIAQVLSIGLETLVYAPGKEIRYFLGIDGGGTKTAFLLEDKDGTAVAQCTLGSSNPNDIGMEGCAAVLDAGIREVTAGIDRREAAVFAGLSGGGSGANPQRIARVLAQYGFGSVSNGSDTENALEICLQGGDGVAVIAGTGSIAFAQRDGKRKRIGGWGYLIDSGGCGYTLGRDALDAALRAFDGRGEPTVLLEELSAHFQKSLELAIPEIYSGGKRLIASLCPIVFAAARKGDRTAEAILRQNSDYLAGLIREAVKFSGKDAPVVICGGLANEAETLRGLLTAQLGEDIHLQFNTKPMVHGAVLCARRNYAENRNAE